MDTGGNLVALRHPRDNYWQVVRGVCIVAVIWIHTRDGINYQQSSTAWNFDYWITSRQIVNFPVAMFLFLAGYFVNPARLAPARPWLASRAVKLLVPFYVWSLIYTLLNVIGGATRDMPSIVFGFVFGRSAGHLYFLLVLVQLTLITPLLSRAIGSRWALSLFLITPLYLIGMYTYTNFSGSLPGEYGSFFPAWFAFYYAGMWIRFRRITPSRRVGVSAALALVALTASIAEAYALLALGFPVGLASSQLKVSSILYAFALINLAFTLKSQASMRVTTLSRIGDESYGVYYVHIVWLRLISVIASRVTWLAEFPVLLVSQIVEVGIALALSCVAIRITRRVLGPRRASTLLGF